jgi:FtsH-binding integral membrane protein
VSVTARGAGGGGRPDLFARLQGALPLLVVYFALAALYAWQASRRPVPTIFTDELELTQLSRAIAETGEPARRGESYGLAPLVAYLLAPVWWLGSISTAYATAKLVLVLSMTATVFPAYALARLVVPRWYALAAAGGATAVPALAYSPILVEEPLAYPLSTLALWLIARALVQPGRGRIAVAALASAAAALTRTQLAILFVVLVLGLGWLLWQSEPVRRWRAGWSVWDWAGAVVLFVGLALGFSALMGHLSLEWRNTTGFYRERILEHSAWAMGALATGIGILPLIAGIAGLARPRGEQRDPQTRAFVVTSVVALLVFVWYTGIKGAYISTIFSTLVYERNLIYLCPILFAATALLFARGVGRWWAIAGAAVVAFYVVAAVPLRLGSYPYYEAHGLAIAAFANRELSWPESRIENALIVVCLVSLAVVLALRFLRKDSVAFTVVTAVAAGAVLTWSLTAEVYAAAGERDLSQQFGRYLPKPYDWVEQATGGSPVVVLGQRISDGTGVWLTEFFNPSIRKMWSLDGTAKGPGPILTPDLEAPDGTLTPPPETDYALALNGVELQATEVERRGSDVLYRLDGRPLQLKDAVVGVERDGWITGSSEEKIARASYTRYDVSKDPPGFAIVKLSRVEWCGGDVPGKATIRIGPVTIGPDKQPAIANVTGTQTKIVHQCVVTPFLLAAPRVPWRVEVTIEPTFSPHDLVPSHSDRRQLGAVFFAGFQPLLGG